MGEQAMGQEAAQTPRLIDLLNEDVVDVKVYAANWIDAIRKAGLLLVNVGSVEPRYVDAMVRFCEQYKSYIVIAPGIALPHARPEDGVKRIGISIITLKEPIYFGHPENDPVDIVIAFGAIDSRSHINILKDLSEFLLDYNNVEAIRKANSKSDLIKVFHNAIK
ncbi:MAG: PTS sugar transporter subunit IIA [Desulfurococcaceae archaeon]